MGCRSGIRRLSHWSMPEWSADGSGGFRPAFPLIAFGIVLRPPLSGHPDPLFLSPKVERLKELGDGHHLGPGGGSIPRHYLLGLAMAIDGRLMSGDSVATVLSWHASW